MSLFITFEGPDGSGKTTQIARLIEFLSDKDCDVIATREPGGTSIGDQIREVVHAVDNQSMQSATELLLYSASRAQLVREVIRPHLDRGGVVISDRYADSTLAYQGYGRCLDMDALHTITAFATGNLRPDLTFLLDITAEEGLRRRKGSGGEWNRLDQETVDFHTRVREGFIALAQTDMQRWVLIDASRGIDEVQSDIRKEVEKRLSGL